MTLQEITTKMKEGAAKKSSFGNTVKFSTDQGVVFIDGNANPPTVSNDDKGADCTLKMALSDWVRLAIYIQEQRDQPTCFGQYIRDLGRTQIAIPKIPGVNGYFSGYGFLTWTDNDMVPSTAWAVGAYGQRIGWSIKERNTKVFLSFGDGSDPDMNKIYPLANRWIN